jgi:hypothetical protein
MKKCANPKCGWKELAEFNYDRSRGDRKNQYCKVCAKERSQKIYLENAEGHKERSKRYIRKVKLEALDQYGKVCQCCGESRIEFLVLDHINGDGAEHRRSLNSNKSCTGYAFYLWLRKNGWPRDIGLQVLCANCNTAKGSCGQCPHVKESEANLIDGLGI